MPDLPVSPVRRPVALAAVVLLSAPGALAGPGVAHAGSAPDDGDCSAYVGLAHVSVQRADHDGQVLTGGPGPDVLIAGTFRDVTLVGAGRADYLCGGPGDDVINGGSGQDAMWGGDGSDLLVGGPGDDSLEGGAGNDRVDAGKGFDVVTVDNTGPSPGPDGVSDTVDGGAQDDELSLTWVTYAPGDVLEIDATTGAATMASGLHVAFSGIEDYDGGRHLTRFTGSDEFERFVSWSRDTRVRMGGGNDEVDAWRGNVVDLGPGADVVFVIDVATVRGGAGKDFIDIGFERRRWSTTHADYDGGSGRDTFEVDSNLNDSRVADVDAVDATFSGGPGQDMVDLAFLASRVTADLDTGTATWRRSRLDWTGLERFRGSAVDDDIRGSAAADDIGGAKGDDVIHGLAGDDVLAGGHGHDRLWGGSGRDTCATGEDLHLCEAG
jgi:Ca2+-binding RTX toxin-like protein